MTYLQQFEEELRKKLESPDDQEAIVHWAGEELLKSYKNGITAGRKGASVIRKGESRRTASPGRAL